MSESLEGPALALKRDLILKMGPPLFVPSRPFGEDWRIGGWHRSSEASGAIAASVNAHDRSGGRSIDIETSVTFGDTDQVSVANVLMNAVPREVELPLTLTATERSVLIPVSSSLAEFRLVEAGGRLWIAVCEIEGRGIRVKGSGFPPELLILERVTDLTSLPAVRWETPSW